MLLSIKTLRFSVRYQSKGRKARRASSRADYVPNHRINLAR